MMAPETAIRTRSLAAPLAEFMAKQPFNEAECIVAEIYDLVNELRDAHIRRAHTLIEGILNQPDFPTERWKKAIIDLNGVIKMMEGAT